MIEAHDATGVHLRDAVDWPDLRRRFEAVRTLAASGGEVTAQAPPWCTTAEAWAVLTLAVLAGARRLVAGGVADVERVASAVGAVVDQ